MEMAEVAARARLTGGWPSVVQVRAGVNIGPGTPHKDLASTVDNRESQLQFKRNRGTKITRPHP